MAYENNHWAQTLRGDRFDYDELDNPEQIHASHIAWALGRRGRYLGFTRKHYSVAEHCILLAEYALIKGKGIGMALWSMGHDGPEAYIPDFPRPWKHMPEIRSFIERQEARIMSAIATRFGFPGRTIPEWVTTHDSLILYDEALQVLDAPPIDDWHLKYAPGIGATIQFLEPEEAERAWFYMFTDLLSQYGQENDHATIY